MSSDAASGLAYVLQGQMWGSIWGWHSMASFGCLLCEFRREVVVRRGLQRSFVSEHLSWPHVSLCCCYIWDMSAEVGWARLAERGAQGHVTFALAFLLCCVVSRAKRPLLRSWLQQPGQRLEAVWALRSGGYVQRQASCRTQDFQTNAASYITHVTSLHTCSIRLTCNIVRLVCHICTCTWRAGQLSWAYNDLEPCASGRGLGHGHCIALHTGLVPNASTHMPHDGASAGVLRSPEFWSTSGQARAWRPACLALVMANWPPASNAGGSALHPGSYNETTCLIRPCGAAHNSAYSVQKVPTGSIQQLHDRLTQQGSGSELCRPVQPGLSLPGLRDAMPLYTPRPLIMMFSPFPTLLGLTVPDLPTKACMLWCYLLWLTNLASSLPSAQLIASSLLLCTHVDHTC